jgi:hypothetical protein
MAAFDLSAIVDALSRQGQGPFGPQMQQWGGGSGIGGGSQGGAFGGAFGSQLGGPPAGPVGQFLGLVNGTGAAGAAAGGAFGSQVGAPGPGYTYGTSNGMFHPMGLGSNPNVYSGGLESAHGQNAIGPPRVRQPPAAAPKVAPKPGELTRAPAQMWAGGFGTSDNSAWGNKGDAALMQRSGMNGSLQEMSGQSSSKASQVNGILPGAGSVFGLGGAR